jgi:hypothetical protein
VMDPFHCWAPLPFHLAENPVAASACRSPRRARHAPAHRIDLEGFMRGLQARLISQGRAHIVQEAVVASTGDAPQSRSQRGQLRLG